MPKEHKRKEPYPKLPVKAKDSLRQELRLDKRKDLECIYPGKFVWQGSVQMHKMNFNWANLSPDERYKQSLIRSHIPAYLEEMEP